MEQTAAATLDKITTRWSQLRDPLRFVMRYSGAIQAYLRALLRDEDLAEEACQEFLSTFLYRGLPAAEPSRGRFRDFLKVSVRNAAISLLRKRKAPTIDPAVLDRMSGDDSAEREWIAGWQQAVLERAWRELESRQRRQPGNLGYAVLRLSLDRPEATSEALAAELEREMGQPLSSVAFRQQLSRARRAFAEAIAAEVGRTLERDSTEQLRDELAELGLLVHVRDYLEEPKTG